MKYGDWRCVVRAYCIAAIPPPQALSVNSPEGSGETRSRGWSVAQPSAALKNDAFLSTCPPLLPSEERG
jgi:hypothetical protein